MNSKKILKTILIFFIITSINLISCKQESKDASGVEAVTEELARDASSVPEGDIIDKAKKKQIRKQDIKKGFKAHFLLPFEKTADRFLEYKVNLIYKCDDLLESRQSLLGITSKYGFVKQSNSSAEGSNSYMTVDLFIKSNLIYDALKDLNELGILESERITVIDHTEDMVRAERKRRREQTRIIRKNKAISTVSAAAKTWKDREDSLERSENELDRMDHKKWKINDSVSWAKVHIYLKGPDIPERIDVPNYQDAFVGILNTLLKMLYAVIILSPFIIIIGLILWKRKKIFSIFKKGKKE